MLVGSSRLANRGVAFSCPGSQGPTCILPSGLPSLPASAGDPEIGTGTLRCSGVEVEVE